MKSKKKSKQMSWKMFTFFALGVFLLLGIGSATYYMGYAGITLKVTEEPLKVFMGQTEICYSKDSTVFGQSDVDPGQEYSIEFTFFNDGNGIVRAGLDWNDRNSTAKYVVEQNISLVLEPHTHKTQAMKIKVNGDSPLGDVKGQFTCNRQNA